MCVCHVITQVKFCHSYRPHTAEARLCHRLSTDGKEKNVGESFFLLLLFLHHSFLGQ